MKCENLINEMALESYPSEEEYKLLKLKDLFDGKIELPFEEAWELVSEFEGTENWK